MRSTSFYGRAQFVFYVGGHFLPGTANDPHMMARLLNKSLCCCCDAGKLRNVTDDHILCNCNLLGCAGDLHKQISSQHIGSLRDRKIHNEAYTFCFVQSTGDAGDNTVHVCIQTCCDFFVFYFLKQFISQIFHVLHLICALGADCS